MKRLLTATAILLAMPVATVPAMAQTAATPAQQKTASQFVSGLADEAFAILRDESLSRDDARTRFQTLLQQNFAVNDIGNRLIRRHRAGLKPEQLRAYQKALPTFVVNTYSERLYDFAASKVTVVRAVPRGSRGDVDVYTKISNPGGGQPFDAIWTIKSGTKPLVANLTVNGVNVALTQEQDFSAYIERNGFDALVAFMQKAK